jgi:secondary thiamine-phosphate synthase enzyme
LKRLGLIRRLEQSGCLLLRHGGRHDIYHNPQTGRSEPDSGIEGSTRFWPGGSFDAWVRKRRVDRGDHKIQPTGTSRSGQCGIVVRWRSVSAADADRYTPMKSLTEHLWFEVPNRRGFVNITSTVENLVDKSGVKEGLVLINAMHITASVFINDEEEGLKHDYDVWLEKLAPHAPTSQYQHNRTGEDNADAHMKRQIMGREVVVAITKGKLDFGPWEQIFYGEFDGRRRKRVLVKIIGE